jgi:flagellin
LSIATSGNTAADTIQHAVDSLNSQFIAKSLFATYGTYADWSGSDIVNHSSSTFSIDDFMYSAGAGGAGTPGAGSIFGTSAGTIDVTAPPSVGGTSIDSAANARSAISAIGDALAKLGSVQGRVGAGQNQLGYALTLAQSQVTNFSTAESGIRDADIASEAATLTRVQILMQVRSRPWRKRTPRRR